LSMAQFCVIRYGLSVIGKERISPQLSTAQLRLFNGVSDGI
jgi:hypothetical protein